MAEVEKRPTLAEAVAAWRYGRAVTRASEIKPSKEERLREAEGWIAQAPIRTVAEQLAIPVGPLTGPRGLKIRIIRMPEGGAVPRLTDGLKQALTRRL